MKFINHNWINTLLIVAVGILVLVGSNQSEVGGTRFPNGLSADGTSPTAGQVRGTTLLSTGAATFSSTIAVTGAATLSSTLVVTGATDLGNTTIGGGCFATTTISATDIWTETEMIANNCFVYSGADAAPAITITLPATTTLTTLIPNAGDTKTWFYDPSAYATATTTTFVAGTGIILMEPGDGDAHNVVIAGATSAATITFMRRSDTDVYAIIAEISDAD